MGQISSNLRRSCALGRLGREVSKLLLRSTFAIALALIRASAMAAEWVVTPLHSFDGIDIRVHHGRHQPISVAAATAPLATAPLTAAVVTAAVVTAAVVTVLHPAASPRRSHRRRCCVADPMPGRLSGLPFRRDGGVREDVLRRLLYADDRPERADDSYVHTLAARLRGVLRNPCRREVIRRSSE